MKFRIELASIEYLTDIMEVMKEANQTVEKEEWFVADEENYVKHVLEGNGFIIGAWEEETEELAGFFMVYYPDKKENMGIYAGLFKKELSKVVYMDSAAVKLKYRGNGLQTEMLKRAEEYLNQLQEQSGEDIQYRMCTVHPDNQYSLSNMQKSGYRIVAREVLYGGLDRYVLCKRKSL